MSAQVLFNQFVYADRLKQGGFSEDQVRAPAKALGATLHETVATKWDLERNEPAVRADRLRLDAKLSREIKRLVDDKIDLFQVELKTDIARSANDVIRWAPMINIASIGLPFTAMKPLK